MCECDLCTYGRKVREQLALIPEPQREFFKDMHLQLFDAEAELNYYQAIADGSWPQAEEILTRWLKKAASSG
jgi:hypothetical protein